jgi:hypothetical protein
VEEEVEERNLVPAVVELEAEGDVAEAVGAEHRGGGGEVYVDEVLDLAHDLADPLGRGGHALIPLERAKASVTDLAVERGCEAASHKKKKKKKKKKMASL